ncbi:hypothetical protein FDI69_gp053 [Rhodococcus phage Trina]|uniref:Uncharacterized protein n=1 Tax=Rhodococcus phage Trina TaxID=2027905 RepID=A0A2D1A4P3_9CAUD|nr:hypothetical protein FDI69_gp053 [Rhodococcus phage Trina]ASZ75066.1 hypothetical protein SEA_TRINA_53 [Rhodococcus phage Trina]
MYDVLTVVGEGDKLVPWLYSTRLSLSLLPRFFWTLPPLALLIISKEIQLSNDSWPKVSRCDRELDRNIAIPTAGSNQILKKCCKTPRILCKIH